LQAPSLSPSLTPTGAPPCLRRALSQTREHTVTRTHKRSRSPSLHVADLPSPHPCHAAFVHGRCFRQPRMCDLAAVTPTTLLPTLAPSSVPTLTPTFSPSHVPSFSPSLFPSLLPTFLPSRVRPLPLAPFPCLTRALTCTRSQRYTRTGLAFRAHSIPARRHVLYACVSTPTGRT
jgi:hypothetical protein